MNWEAEIWVNLILWIGIGALAGMGFNILLEASIRKLGSKTVTQQMSVFYILSAFRIIAMLLLLFLAFRQGLQSGIACLLSFIISRWISIFIIAKRNKMKA